jgi:hypothetical protein
LRTRRGRARWTAGAVVVCLAAIGIAVTLRTDDETPSGAPVKATRSTPFNFLPASLSSRTTDVSVVQVDTDRAVVFGGVTVHDKTVSVANDGVVIDFAKKTSTSIEGPELDDGLARVRAAVSGTKVLFFGKECASGPAARDFDGEGYADACVNAPLTLTTFDTTTGAWSDPVTAPPFVGGNVYWVVDASVVGDTAVIKWFESDQATETFTAYDIPSGTWRALDSPPELVQSGCSTRTNFVAVSDDDGSGGGGGVSPRPRLWLLDPKTGEWTAVEVPKLYGPAIGGAKCVANRPVVYGYPLPSFASVLYAYSPADASWRRLPAAPDNVLADRTLGVGDLLVSWATPPKDDPNHTSLQTIDLTQQEPRWSSHPAAALSEDTEFATGAPRDGVVITRVGDWLYRTVVAGKR